MIKITCSKEEKERLVNRISRASKGCISPIDKCLATTCERCIDENIDWEIIPGYEPCPFCGEDEYIASIKHGNGEKWLTICDICGGQTSLYESKNESIEAWNTRVKK